MSTLRITPLLLLTLAGATQSWSEPEGLPAPAEVRPMKFAEPQQKTLANGMQVVVVDRPGLPVLSAGLLIRAGAEADPQKLAGLAQFAGGLLMRGTANRSATQIAQDLEGLGASIKVEAGWDQTVALLTTLSNQASPSLEILSELIRQPAFASAEIERFRKEAVDELTVDLEQPGQLARVAAARAILGSQPYGHSNTGTPASLKRIKREDLTAFHSRNYRPDRSVLIVAGDVRANDVFTLAEKWFGEWKPAEAKELPAQIPAETPESGAILIDMPAAGQAAVYVGRAAPAWKSEDFYIGQVTNAVLGGGFSARLNREVRIKRGLSYGCGSRLNAFRGAGIFGAVAQTKNESAAEVAKVIRGELQKLGEEVVPNDEFAARKAVLTGGFQRELETNEGYVKRIVDFTIHGQPAGAFASTLERIEQVTPAEVKTFAESQLSPDAATVIVVGRGKACEKPLRDLFPKLRVIPQAKVDLDLPNLSAAARKTR